MPGSTYGSPEWRRYQSGRHWLYYPSKYGSSVAAGSFKAAKAFKVASLAAAGYRVAKRGFDAVSQSFSEKEKEMAPSKRRNPSPLVSVPSFSAGRRSSDVSMRSASKSLISRRSAPARIYVGKGLKGSPGFMRRVGGRVQKKSKSKSGAASSKSAGKFRKGTKKLQTLDYYSQRGVVVAREKGGILASDGTEKAQSMLVGHSIFSNLQLRRDLARAMVKMVFTKLGQQIADFAANANPFGRTFEIIVFFRLYPGHAGTNTNFQIPSGTTFEDVVTWFNDNILAVANSNPDIYYEKLWVYETTVATTPVVLGNKIIDIDLTSCKFSIYCKSSLKIQNRTINSTGNLEADDVDNVPLYGKSYSGSGNWAQFGQNSDNTTMVIVDDNASTPPVATRKFTLGNAGALVEPPVRSQVNHCTAVGKAHLDPGQIKTSVLVYRKNFTLNSLVRRYLRGFSGGQTGSRMNIGKYQFFLLEKMIQAVATTDVNAMNIAYELDHKTGIVCTARRALQSNYVTIDTPI